MLSKAIIMMELTPQYFKILSCEKIIREMGLKGSGGMPLTKAVTCRACVAISISRLRIISGMAM